MRKPVGSDNLGRITAWMLATALGISALSVIVVLGAGRSGDRFGGEAQRPSVPPDLAVPGFRAADRLLAGTAALAEERGLVFAALRGTQPIGPELQSRIDARRKDADSALSEVVGLLRSSLFVVPENAFLERFERNRYEIAAERREVDVLLRELTLKEDGAALRWFQQSGRFLQNIEVLLEIIHHKLRRNVLPASVDEYLRLQHLSLLIAERAGRERAIVSGAIASRRPIAEDPLTRGNSIELMRLKGFWQEVKRLSHAGAIPADGLQLVRVFEHHYFGELKSVRKVLEVAGETRSPYPMTESQWFQLASGPIDRVVALGRLSGRHALEQISSGSAARP